MYYLVDVFVPGSSLWLFLRKLGMILPEDLVIPLLVHDRYRRGHSQLAIELSTGSPVGELEKGPKELKGFAAP